MSKKRSWVWQHFQKLTEDLAMCSVCSKTMTCADGSTSGLRRHLKTHDVVEEADVIEEEVLEDSPVYIKVEDVEEDQYFEEINIVDERTRRSWVWNYFTKMSGSTAKCGVCEKVIRCEGSSTSGMSHHLSIHNLNENDVERLDRSFEELRTGEDQETAVDDESSRPKRSWVWHYFVKVSSFMAQCQLCHKEINCRDSSTSGMRTHLRIHNLSEDEENFTQPADQTLKTKVAGVKRSWVWNYFEKTSSSSSQCQICLKQITSAGSSTSAMRNHLKTHNLTEADHNRDRDELLEAEEIIVESPKKKVPELKLREDKRQRCYICDDVVGAFGTPLDTSLEFTNIPINELLESFGLSEPTKNSSSICLECVSSLKRYDEFQHHCQVIQNKISNMFVKTHSEDTVKDEEEIHFDEETIEIDQQSPQKDLSNYQPTESPSKSRKQERAPITRTNVVYQCDKCSKSFTVRSRMIRHLKSHGGSNKGLPCVKCSKVCRSDFHLQTHMMTDHSLSPNGPFECPTCFKVFNTKRKLKMHYYLHKPEKNWLCTLCGQRFGHKSQFTMHLMIHNDLRPFPCEYEGCSKAFRTADKRRIHHRVHSGEKIFECPHCPGKMFAQMWGRDLHIRNFHMSDPNAGIDCNICGNKFPSRSKLKQHQVNAHQRFADEVTSC